MGGGTATAGGSEGEATDGGGASAAGVMEYWSGPRTDGPLECWSTGVMGWEAEGNGGWRSDGDGVGAGADESEGSDGADGAAWPRGSAALPTAGEWRPAVERCAGSGDHSRNKGGAIGGRRVAVGRRRRRSGNDREGGRTPERPAVIDRRYRTTQGPETKVLIRRAFRDGRAAARPYRILSLPVLSLETGAALG